MPPPLPSGAALRFSRPPAPRALALKFTPPLHTLPQSRAVLSSLRHFGPLDSWRDLRHDHHRPRAGVVLALFRTEGDAQRVISRSPLKARLVTRGPDVLSCTLTGSDGETILGPQAQNESIPVPAALRVDKTDGDWGQTATRLLEGLDIHTQSEGRYSREQRRGFSTTAAMEGRWPPRQEKEKVLEFTIYAEKARVDLEAAVRKHPCHGAFEVHVRTAVAGSVAARAPLRGLADLTLRRERVGWKEIGRTRRKKGSQVGGLREIYEEGRRAREDKVEG